VRPMTVGGARDLFQNLTIWWFMKGATISISTFATSAENASKVKRKWKSTDWCTLPHSLWRKWLDWSQNVLFTKNWYNFYAKTILIHSGDFFVIRTTIVISDQNLIKMFIRLILNHNWLKQLFTLAIAQNFKLTKKPAKLTFNITCFPRVYIKKLNFINIVAWLFICCVVQTISQLLVYWTLFKNN